MTCVGTSVAAGLPTWGSLLTSLANRAQMTKEELDLLWDINVMDQACIVEKRLGGSENLKKEIIR